MAKWNAYKLERIYKKDRHEKPKLDGHREVLVGIVTANDKTEAQLIVGALFGSHSFVCSIDSDLQHKAVLRGHQPCSRLADVF